MAFRGWDKELIVLPGGREVEASCPVIMSASRATDIPAFFSQWFSTRLHDGYVRWTNPFNANQVQYVSFKRTRVIIFWSKNPKPLLRYLPQIENAGINYYFQFTVNDYDKENLESNVPKLTDRIDTFKSLSNQLGSERVIWRFDPLILSDSLTVDVLINRISSIASLLQGYTKKLVFSFADINIYKKVSNNLALQPSRYHEFTPNLMHTFAQRLCELNKDWGLEISTCSEDINLETYGINKNRCIDDNLMVDLFPQDSTLMDFLGFETNLFGERQRPYLKDKNQRKDCGCIISKDIGTYDTCNHLCAYCYANTSSVSVANRIKRHDPKGDALIS